MHLRHILYRVKFQSDNNLFCTLCAIPHLLQAVVIIYPEIHFFTIKYIYIYIYIYIFRVNDLAEDGLLGTKHVGGVSQNNQ